MIDGGVLWEIPRNHPVTIKIFLIMASMDTSESGFQTSASKKRKASDLLSFPPASHLQNCSQKQG